MKKVLIAFLVLAVTLSLCACGTSTPDTGSKSTATVKTKDANADAENFPETVLVDNESCSITVKSISVSSSEYTLKVALQNKTDLNLMFSVDSATVDGWDLDPFWADTVTPGMQAVSNISFSVSDLKECGITAVNCIRLSFRVYDSDDWTAENVLNEEFVIYPLGAQSFTPTYRTPAETDTVLTETDAYSIVVTGFDPDNFWGYTMKLYLCNKTGSTLMFSVQDAAVNGIMCDPFWATSVAPGSQKLSNVSWSDSTLKECGITAISELSLPFSVTDEATFDHLCEETFVVNPK